DVAKAVAGNDETKIGESVDNGAGADASSVKGIAMGMKEIVDAATEGGVKFETAAVVNDDVSNKDAGKLFGTAAGGADAAAVAGDVVKKVNGWLEKMLKAAEEIAKAVAGNDETKIGESVN
ncbi:variable large family protein, partial [Borreliella garinii]|uniref:variable large family protein n=1 Tax=Borreliella garinii TaxID=29519 RepID=UPI001AED2554